MFLTVRLLTVVAYVLNSSQKLNFLSRRSLINYYKLFVDSVQSTDVYKCLSRVANCGLEKSVNSVYNLGIGQPEYVSSWLLQTAHYSVRHSRFRLTGHFSLFINIVS